MKHKNFKKKLVLNKKTVMNLSVESMQDIRGLGLQSVPESACPILCMRTIVESDCTCPTLTIPEICCWPL